MDRKHVLIALAVAAGFLVLGVLIAQQTPKDALASAAVAIPIRDESPPASSSVEVEPVVPDGSQLDGAVEPPPEARSQPAPEALTAAVDYAEKYRGATRAELLVAEDDLALKVNAEVERIRKEVAAKDDYEYVVVGPGEQAPSVSTTPESPFVSSSITFGPPEADGTTRIGVKVFDKQNYPDLYALQSEHYFVSERLRRLRRAAK